MRVGDLIRMKAGATINHTRTGIIISSRYPSGHRFQRHTISWSDGTIKEYPEDVLRVCQGKSMEVISG